MDIMEVLKQNWYVFTVMIIACVVAVVYGYARLAKMKVSNQNFLAKHPDSAKIYLTQRALITSEAVTVYSVDGEAPQSFNESGKTGFYVVPGERKVEVDYTYSRPGIMHKNVTESTGVVEKTLMTEPRKSYLLSFDRDEEAFTFTEV